MNKQYLVLIGDIVQSRALPDRDAVQRKFSSECARLNADAKVLKLVSPLTITLGDEFQAVFKSAAMLWECVLRLEAAMDPISLRFAVGAGPITTRINKESAIGMDGPAFYAAREAMGQLKKKGKRYRLAGVGEDEELLNAMLDMFASNRAKWRVSRVKTLVGLLQGKTASEIRKVTGTTEQAVYRNIRDGALEPIHVLLAGVASRLDAALSKS